MTEEEIQQALRLQEIFLPYSMSQRREAHQRQGVEFLGPEGLRFAHYTSAEAALSILRSKRIWMRNTLCMADYREVQHGFEILHKYFSSSPQTEAFVKALDVCAPGAATEAINLFNGWWQSAATNNIPFNTFITSVSEHDPKSEDRHGRLSMWRAFANASVTRVALIVRLPNRPDSGVDALRVMFSPVAYLTEEEMHEQIRMVVANVAREEAYLRLLDGETIVRHLFLMLFVAVTCLKHEGFREEREWRVVYNHNLFPSDMMERSIETVAGVPQQIYKIPLDKNVSPLLANLDLSAILDHVIIGPSPHPWVLYQAFVEELKKAGVPKAEERVLVSGIPIRH